MRRQLRSRCLVAWLVLGIGAGAEAQDAISPSPERPTESPPPREGGASATPTEMSPAHEALQPSGERRDPEHIGKAPPAMIAERPGALRPGPDAHWIEGYWDWDRSRDEFAWVTGTWLVPPPGEFWVNGYWRRDVKGWYRVPGFWSGGGRVQEVVRVQQVSLNGRGAGPSSTRPEESVGIAPGPDYFYIPGEYIPAWGGVVWRPGFWAPSQPGWEWIPARWERRADAWAFREGFWHRVPGTPTGPPGGLTPGGGITLTAATAGIGPPPARMTSSPAAPAGAAATRGETNQEAAETAQSGQGAGKTTQDGARPKPGDPKPGPQPESPQTPPYASYGPQPAYYYPQGGPMWNARSMVGGFLRRVLP